MKFVVFILLLWPVLAGAGTWPGDWEKLMKVEISRTQVGATNLSHFPVLLTEDNIHANVWSDTQSDGGDLRISAVESPSSDTDLLGLEVVSWDNSGETAELYVSESGWTVNGTGEASDTAIWLFYKTTDTDSQPAASAAGGSESVWNSGYDGVYHLDDTITTIDDSTSNGNDLTAETGMVRVTGYIGYGFDFVRDVDTNDQMSLATQDLSGGYSWEVWSKWDELDTDAAIAGLSGSSAIQWWMDSGPPDNYDVYLDGAGVFCSGTGTPSTNWEYHAITYEDATDGWVQYLDNTTDATGCTANIASNNGTMYLGATSGATTKNANGVFDEFRYSNVERSGAWIGASYNSQSAPGTFAVESAPQDVGGAAATIHPWIYIQSVQ